MSILAVAQKAGVSPATVSRVFNAPQAVHPDTRGRVERAARSLRYVPNRSASTLRSQRSKTLGIILPTLLNPVFAECLAGIAAEANLHGFAIVPLTTEYSTDNESRALQQLLARSVDGMVLTVGDAAKSPTLAAVKRARVPYVLAYNQHPKHACVGVDNKLAVHEAVLRLQAAGHRNIAMVSGTLAASDRAQQRYAGYQSGLASLDLGRGTLIEVPFMSGGLAGVAAALIQRRRPTAILCSNDLLALRVIRTVRSLGLDVPRDLSVVGFDGIAVAAEVAPSLTTIAQPNEQIGRTCVQLLLQDKAAVTAALSKVLPFDFRTGESLGPPPSAVSNPKPSYSRRT
jgi:LacI family transcriptional regulator, repressor for deo operon, udp, cdd, tsx, nupC, and nupG